MKSLVDEIAHRAGIEDMLLSQQAATEDREGRVSQGQALSRRASAAARQAGDTEVSANLLAVEARRQILLGDNAAALRLVDQAMAVPKATQGEDVQILAGLVSAAMGNLPRARRLMTDLTHAHPSDSIVQHYWIPLLRARIALAENHPETAISLLKGTEPYDLGIFEPGQCMDAAYLRGEAWLSLHQATAATEQFRNILAHRGLVLNCPTSALAQLGIARALALAGDTAGSRAAYQDLLALWKDADPDFQLAKQAQSEYRSLR